MSLALPIRDVTRGQGIASCLPLRSRPWHQAARLSWSGLLGRAAADPSLGRVTFQTGVYSALLAQLIAQELLRAVEDALCLLDGGLNLFDLPICRLAQPPRLLDKFPSTRNGLRRLTQIGSFR